MKKIRKQGVKRTMQMREKLILSFAIVLLIPTISLGIISFQTADAKVEEKMYENAISSVTVLNQTIDQIIGATRKNVDFLASQLDAGNVEPNRVTKQIPSVPCSTRIRKRMMTWNLPPSVPIRACILTPL